MDQYRVYGNPIKQSLSPYIHKYFAKQTNQNIDYQADLVPLNNFEATVLQFIKEGGKGANVTAPFKEQAMKMCHHLSDRAVLCGAVNTLTFKNGAIYGDTTDGDGLVNDLIQNQIVIENKRILLLGAGGAAKGVVLPLLQKKPLQLTIANRTESRAQHIVEQFPNDPLKATTFSNLGANNYDLIINATSAGLNGEALPINADIINKRVTCYDMSYANKLTPFLAFAKQHGATSVIDGLGMLVGQAAVSFNIWRDVQPDSLEVLAKLRQEKLQ